MSGLRLAPLRGALARAGVRGARVLACTGARGDAALARTGARGVATLACAGTRGLAALRAWRAEARERHLGAGA